MQLFSVRPQSTGHRPPATQEQRWSSLAWAGWMAAAPWSTMHREQNSQSMDGRSVAVLDSSRTIPYSAPMLAQVRRRAARYSSAC